MASIFRRDDNYVDQPKRNTVDFSFQNNLTADFGSLRPCFCTPVMPGDSFEIQPTFGLKFMPMTFPVQTRMKASIHYFYVRNRNLWKDWQDFIGKTKDGLIPPYIHLTEQNRKQIETCQLGDFLGIPTRVYGEVIDSLYNSIYSHDYYHYMNAQFQPNVLGCVYVGDYTSLYESSNQIGLDVMGKITPRGNGYQYQGWYGLLSYTLKLRGSELRQYLDKEIRITFNNNDEQEIYKNYQIENDYINDYRNLLYICDQDGHSIGGYSGNYDVSKNRISIPLLTGRNPNYIDSSVINDNLNYTVVFILDLNNATTTRTPFSLNINIINSVKQDLDVADLPLSDLPWRSDENPNGIPLSVLPFRAYESIYNSFYRNAENNPLLVNGVPEYNKWLRTDKGGPDTNFYSIMYHNWEDDFLTTAVPSPQQGNAPLVGLSGTSTLTVAHDDGTTTEMSLEVDENGQVTAANAVSGDAPTQQALVEAVSYGISINDFRNVNSFQRWLENNIRRGYKYRDQIKTHYGVTVRYDELDMPEFIGGATEHVMVNQISQTTPVDGAGLGDVAGQASAVGQGQKITHYCDEHGFIIGILCVKPVANYSQLLPKYFNVTDTFDYYFPEFGHIGMQPITYAEVTPLQANLEGKLNDVFGYQRAWYDLIAKTDEVHGLFRSELRNFLINRTFDGTPELGKEFTVIDPEQINDVFQYQGNTDKILGQIYMKISKKTPIPLYGIPKLE